MATLLPARTVTMENCDNRDVSPYWVKKVLSSYPDD